MLTYFVGYKQAIQREEQLHKIINIRKKIINVASLQATYHNMCPSLKIVCKKNVSNAQELELREVVRAPRIIIRRGWMLHAEYSCPWQIPSFGSELYRKQKRKLFFLPPWLWIFMNLNVYFKLLNYMFALWIKMFWFVNSTFLGQFYSFFILDFCYNFQPMPLSEID